MKIKLNTMKDKTKKILKEKNENSKMKHSKHIIISGTFLFLLLFLGVSFETTHFYNNYIAYETLNNVREEVNLNNYDETNYIVKNQTLDSMEEDIESQLIKFYNKYIESVEDTKIDDSLEDLKANENINEYEKYKQAKKIVANDLETHINTEKKEINNVNIEEHELTESEQKQYATIESNLSKLGTSETNIEKLYTDYQEVTKLKSDTKSLEKDIKAREAKEQKEAEEEAKREAQAKKEAEEEAEAASTLDFSNLTSDAGVEGNFNRAIGENMFTAINAYRSSLGLAPYSYNSGMQSCVDQEALAYGTTQNPHNWVCPVANENASNAPVGSDAVSISMDFFMTDPPHEAVLSGNYSSVAVSAYESGGTDYIIVGVF